MGRKKYQFLESLTILSAVLLLLAGCQSRGDEGARTTLNFNLNWRFINQDIENAQLAGFDDSDWRKLDLPHDWAIEGPFNKNVSFRGGSLPYPGVGWYRKSFDIEAKGKKVSIEFDGVMRDAMVWVNGRFVGNWAYGYSSLSFDITKYLSDKDENIIAVRVENKDNSSRWYPGSGIYRNVRLIVKNPINIAHWGTYITTQKISNEEAELHIETELLSYSSKPANIKLENSIIDAGGNEVAEDESEGKLTPSGKMVFKQNLTIPQPHRWDIESPYMYKVVSRVKQNGKVIDNCETPFGIRTFHFDADEGFFLNGRSVKLKGVNLHHDLGPLGSAVNYRATERQIEIMKKMGVNSIRTAHNPPSQELLKVCDKLGVLVLDEAFDEWRQAKGGITTGYSTMFDEWAAKDVAAMIKRDRNHPSVILWSTGNEIPELGTKDGKNSARILADICRELDPTRPVTSGIHLSIKLDKELMDIFDVAGFNYWHKSLPEIHKEYPNKPLLVTEAAAVLSSRGFYCFPVKRIYSGFRDESLQISSYDLVNTGFGALPDIEFKLQDDYKWLAGQFVWSGFDYHGEPDPYEDMWPAHSSYFGIVDMCGFPKDRYFLYQSVWTDEPMIHLLPHWNWEDREGEITPVYVYSNCVSVELLVNGNSHGRKPKKKGEYRYIWDDVIYKPGSIKAVGYDADGKNLCEEEIKTAGKPASIEIAADRNTIEADGQDLSFVTVKVLDAKGNFCPTAENLIKFKIEDVGEIAAVGNGNSASIESYQAHERKLFNGMCLVIVKSEKKPGKIKLTAESEGLQSGSIQISTTETAR